MTTETQAQPTVETQGNSAPAQEAVTPTPTPAAEEPKAETPPTPAPAAEPAKTEDTKSADSAVESEGPEFMTYGHPAADAAVDMIREAGVTPDAAAAWFKEAAATQDLSKIDLNAMKAALGDAKAAVVHAAVKDFLGETIRVRNEAVNTVYEAVGGKEAFDTIREYVTKSNDPKVKEQLAVLLPMFELGKGAAAIAAREMKALYEAGPNNSGLANKVVSGDGLATGGGETISKSDYYAQVSAANKRRDYAEVQRLRDLRVSSRKSEGQQ